MPRPFSVTLLTLGVLTLATAGLVRLEQAISLWEFLVSLTLSPLYLAVTGQVLGIAGLPVAWGLWWGLPWAPRFCTGYVLTTLTYYWLDRLFLTQTQSESVNTPFAIVVTMLVMGFMFWVFRRKNSQDFFNHRRTE